MSTPETDVASPTRRTDNLLAIPPGQVAGQEKRSAEQAEQVADLELPAIHPRCRQPYRREAVACPHDTGHEREVRAARCLHGITCWKKESGDVQPRHRIPDFLAIRGNSSPLLNQNLVSLRRSSDDIEAALCMGDVAHTHATDVIHLHIVPHLD